MEPGSHQTSDVGHIHEEVGPHLMGDVGKGLEVDDAGVGGSASQDHLGLMLLGQIPDLVVVDIALLIDTIGHHVVVLAGEVDGRAVGQVATVGQIHAQHGVAVLAKSLIHSEVGVGAAVGLHIGVVGSEELAGPLAGDLLHHVHALAAAVVPLAGIALGIFIGEHRTRRGQHRLADEVLRGDELNVALLPGVLRLNGLAYLRVLGGKKLHDILDQCLSPPFKILAI